MSNKSPLALVNEKFGGKDKLVETLVGLLETDATKEDLRSRLLGVSNAKLLRLHDVANAVREAGGREKLIANATAAMNRAKDKDYSAKLGKLPTKRLYDVTSVAQRRAKRAETKKASAKAPAAAGKKSGKGKSAAAAAK